MEIYFAVYVQAMESKLLRGGMNIVDHTNEQQRALEQRRQEIAEQQVAHRLFDIVFRIVSLTTRQYFHTVWLSVAVALSNIGHVNVVVVAVVILKFSVRVEC